MRVGLVGRFRPLHKGAANMLEALCEEANEVVIGIGSSNRYDMRNPFTAHEAQEIIEKTLGQYKNISFLHIPDYGHIKGCEDGSCWKKKVIDSFGSLDAFVSGNEYVQELLGKEYHIINPLVEDNELFKGSIVRYLMTTNDDWQSLVPKPVAQYLLHNGLVERFRQEFGKQTREYVTQNKSVLKRESLFDEQRHILGLV